VKTWLLDTGPSVAYLDANDVAHDDVAECLAGFTGRLVTTGAVITEAMHFVSAADAGPALLAEFIAASRLEIFDLCQQDAVTAAATIMRKYANVPMDFADATLVLLGELLDVHDILTLDQRGFRVFRDRLRRSFRLVLTPRR